MNSLFRHRSSRVGVSLAIAVAMAAAGAASASAYSIDSISGGPAYSGSFGGNQIFKKGYVSGYTMSCSSATAVGATQNVPGDPASTDLVITFRGTARNYNTGAFDACLGGIFSPNSVATGPWRLTVAGPPTSGSYPLSLSILPGSPMVWTQQLGGGPVLLNSCITTFDSVGNTGLTGLWATPTATGLRISGGITGMQYTMAGMYCNQGGPLGTFSNGAYHTGSGVELAGVTINP